jgi:hypothetical protein
MTRETEATAPRIVELVGPPGAGKSTIFTAIEERDAGIARPPLLRKTESLLFVQLGRVVATLVGHRVMPHGLGPVREMLYVQALPEIIGRASPASAVVFDQGPVFSLTRPSLTDERLADWHETWFDAWAPLLDLVVWLDAPDAVLIERINSRPKWHGLKGGDAVAARAKLLKDREVYERALADLESRERHPRILRFDTARTLPADVAGEIVAALRPAAPSPVSDHSGQFPPASPAPS